MKLTDYMHQKQLHANGFAAIVGYSPATVGRWLKGGSLDLDAMEHIMKVTDGAVTPNDFLRQDGAK